uniref:Uncharacterized protein n=1 Tax=Romanomermis culicivorax TaxID=13658 RepID=A0A915L6T0_ROMCU
MTGFKTTVFVNNGNLTQGRRKCQKMWQIFLSKFFPKSSHGNSEKAKPAVDYLESEEIPPVIITDENLQSKVEFDSSESENEEAAM